MKATPHPQLLAVIIIASGIFALHAHGYADAALSNIGDRTQQTPPVVVALAATGSVVPHRDPFVAKVDEVASEQNISEIGSDAQKSDNSQGLHLRAVVLGTHRYALVSDGSSSQIVTLGSKLAGSTVTDISLRGITLANGASFLPEESGK